MFASWKVKSFCLSSFITQNLQLEADICRCFSKLVFLKILQYLLENNCVPIAWQLTWKFQLKLELVYFFHFESTLVFFLWTKFFLICFLIFFFLSIQNQRHWLSCHQWYFCRGSSFVRASRHPSCMLFNCWHNHWEATRKTS